MEKKKSAEHQEGTSKNTASFDLIRTELNIEKWAGLWRPAHDATPAKVRVLEREYRGRGGVLQKAKVEIGFSHLGGLTTEDQKTYYALVKQWENAERTPRQVFFSIRGLARILHKKWGTNVIDAITASLRRLRATPITWENAYFDAGSRETLEQTDTLNIISELKIVRRKIDGRVTKEAGYFRFNDFTLKNLLINHTKPVLFETILAFRTDLAQLLYTHLDLIMADKRVFERRTRDLCVDLGLQGNEFSRVYQRKRSFSKAIDELRGVMLTTGMIAAIDIVRTKDNTDYKLTVKKGSRVSAPPEERPLPVVAATVADIEHADAARDVVRHFHKIFHGVENSNPQSKEVAQATSLVAQHGFDGAKYIVDYAHTAAAETKYRPQTFGGILQYASRAVPVFDELRRREQGAIKLRAQAKTRREFEVLDADLAEKRRLSAEARLRELPEAERQSLRARLRAEILQHHWVKESSPVFEQMLHRRMLSEVMQKLTE